jgi:hypothetical protein
MANFAKTILSGSTDGRGIKVAATATPGTTIHTGPSNTSHLHKVWLYAVNSDTTPRKLTLEWGGTTSPDDLIEFTVEPESGLFLIAPGLLLKGNATPLVVKAFCATANVVMIHGEVDTIT